MKTVVIGLAGEYLSGKSSAAKFYENRFEAKNLRFSQILDTVLKLLDLPNSRENEQALSKTVKDLYGKDVLAKALLNSIEHHHANIFVFDGIRNVEELEALRKSPHFRLIYIKSSLDNRFARMKDRGEKQGERDYTKQEFAALIEHDVDKGIPGLADYADFVITNDDGVKEFESQLTTCLMRIL